MNASDAYARALSEYNAKNYISEIAALESIDITHTDKQTTCNVFSMLSLAYWLMGMSDKSVQACLAACEFCDELKSKSDELSNAILASNSIYDFSAEQFQKLYDLYEQNLFESVSAPFPLQRYNHNKIRVGYLSADFSTHIVMTFTWMLLVGLDRNNFEVYCYFDNHKSDGVTGVLKKAIGNWRDITKLSDKAAAEMIRADEIDILFDLSGHTAHNRLPIMAFRPARVQISGIGYMNSTGLNCVDYFLSDIFCAEDDIAMKKYFTEKIIKLPHSHLCYAPFVNIPATASAPCLKNGYITFGSFNKFSKVNNIILSAWQKILRAVPDSKLILKSESFETDECKNFIAGRFENLGFDIKRVEFRGHSDNYLNEYNEIDIALDTFPYCGGGTTCDALYMGVPVVSLYGDRHGTRFGYSILNNIGVGELAVKTIDEYIQLAVGLAGNYELLSYLHKNLRGMMKNSPLMNKQEYIRAVENAFIQIYKQG